MCDHVRNSHDHSVYKALIITKRNLMSITLGAFKGLTGFDSTVLDGLIRKSPHPTPCYSSNLTFSPKKKALPPSLLLRIASKFLSSSGSVVSKNFFVDSS